MCVLASVLFVLALISLVGMVWEVDLLSVSVCEVVEPKTFLS